MEKIRLLTGDRSKPQIQTLNIPTDRKINWNNIKQQKNLQFTTINDPEMIESLMIEKNAAHLDQTQGTPLTIESLVSLICTDRFTNFWTGITGGEM